MGQQSRSEDRFVRLLIPKHPPPPAICSSQSFPPVESHLPPLCCDEISLERVRWCRSTPTSPYLHSFLFFSCFSSLCHLLSLPFSSSSAIISLIPMAVICEDYWRWWCVLCLCVCVCGRGGVTFTKGPFKYSRSPLDKAYAAAH